MAQGRNDEALRTLAKLRLRSEHEVQDDPLLQVRYTAFCYLPPSCFAPPVLGSYIFTFLPLLSGLFSKIDIYFRCFIRFRPVGCYPDPLSFLRSEFRFVLSWAWLYAHFLDRDARDAS